MHLEDALAARIYPLALRRRCRPSLTPAIKPTDGFWRAEVISLRSMGASFREFDIANSIDGGNLGFNKARHPVDVARTKFDEDAPT